MPYGQRPRSNKLYFNTKTGKIDYFYDESKTAGKYGPVNHNGLIRISNTTHRSSLESLSPMAAGKVPPLSSQQLNEQNAVLGHGIASSEYAS